MQRLSLVGGGARSALWAQQLASLLGIAIITHTDSAAGGALGAARLAWLCTGAAVTHVCVAPPVAQRYVPTPAEQPLLHARYQRFRALYPTPRPAPPPTSPPAPPPTSRPTSPPSLRSAPRTESKDHP